PFGRSHLNVKTLFAVTRGLKREVGLDTACGMLGRPLEGTHHRGHDDAWNIAGILCALLQQMRNV
ncbi:MAG: DNA polymerase III, partial [bacterium]|nr:DNA polymerase III [bacterium]